MVSGPIIAEGLSSIRGRVFVLVGVVTQGRSNELVLVGRCVSNDSVLLGVTTFTQLFISLYTSSLGGNFDRPVRGEPCMNKNIIIVCGYGGRTGKV